MVIKNLTKNTVLAREVTFALTFSQRLMGLLGAKKMPKNSALVIKPCCSVHTFFMNFTIDVIFLDKHNKILKTFSSIKPFRATPIYFNSILVIELPAGTIESTATFQGDNLAIE